MAAHRLVLAANSPMLGKLLAERGEGEAKLLLPDVPGREVGSGQLGSMVGSQVGS